MPDLPTGTVTLLFTDVAGSTRLLSELGERYADALAEHRRVIRAAFAERNGVEVDTQGDAFFYAFARVSDAVAAAQQAQQALAGGPVRTRMGLHTGEPLATDEGYVGMDVHRAARISAAGHGDQVLLSEQTARLLGRADLRDLGQHRLKDIAAPERIFQLGDGDFPPLQSLNQTNLPVPATPFLGRALELVEVTGLLRERQVRLLTLTGTGGSGKTRLAIEAARRLVSEYQHGVWWVALAPLRDPALVLESVAEMLGTDDDLARHIGDKRMLFVLDNFEHVLTAADGLAELLAGCPGLNAIVTSREPLHLTAEREYAVPPLCEPEAVALFLERAVGSTQDASVSDICRRLDCLPLAVELAAARTKALSTNQILDRLEQRLPLLTGGPRDAPERQRTLRATIEWSYDLLSPDEQRLLRHQSVFAGGCTLDAAEEVCDADLDALQSLIEKSLVRHTAERFWMLETIREFAAGELEASGEAVEIRRRHAEFFLMVASSANLSADTEHEPRQELAVAEQDNLRLALGWSLQADPELGLRIALALEMFWVTQNPFEGIRWLNALIEAAPDAPLHLRARAWRAYGGCAQPAGDDAGAELHYEQSLAAFEALGDDVGIAHGLMRLGSCAFYRGDLIRGLELGSRSLAMSRAAGNQTESLALGLVGEVEYALGNHAAGIELMEQSVALAGEIGFTWQRSRGLRRLADRALERGDVPEAVRVVQESLRLSHELDDRMSAVFALARLARLAAELGEPERAGLFWGAVEAEEERGSLGVWNNERDKFADPILTQAGPAFERGRAKGRALELAAAVERGLDS